MKNGLDHKEPSNFILRKVEVLQSQGENGIHIEESKVPYGSRKSGKKEFGVLEKFESADLHRITFSRCRSIS